MLAKPLRSAHLISRPIRSYRLVLCLRLYRIPVAIAVRRSMRSSIGG